MGLYFTYYRVEGRDNFEEYENVEKTLKNAYENLDLEKSYMDIELVLTNSIDSEDFEGSIELLTIYGEEVDAETNLGQVIGFIAPNELPEIVKMVKTKKLHTEEGFLDYFDNLEKEVKDELEDWGVDADSIYNGYFEKLIQLYKNAIKNNNAIMICAT